MKYNPKEHHRKSIRLKEFDYSTPGWYYITICTHDHANLFGKISNSKMHLNKFGLIADKCWKEIPKHFLNTELDYYVIMPNHIHGNIIINYSINSREDTRRDTACCVPTDNNADENRKFGKMTSGSLPVIVRSFKAAVSREINQLRKASGKSIWQRNYYEHIIRNERDLYNTRKYIELNPLKWELDEYYK